MFRVSPVPFIRSAQTVVKTTGTSHEFEDKIRLKSVRGRAAARPRTRFNLILSPNS